MNFVNGIIVKAIDGFFYVLCGKDEYFCKSRKKFRFVDIEPKVGDNVCIGIVDDEKKEGVIEKIYDRISDFIRPQLANITQVFIVISYKNPKMNFEMLNKLIINFEVLGIKLCVIVNKCDLHTEKDIDTLKEIFLNFPYEIIFVSVKQNLNIELITEKIQNNLSCFCGPSGVGKSSIINSILNYNFMDVSDLSSKIKRGRHTTRFSQIIYLEYLNGYIVDTPGFTSVDIHNDITKDNLKDYFIEFNEYRNCRFRGCAHINELDCSVKDAVKAMNINKLRYDLYIKIYNKFKEKRK